MTAKRSHQYIDRNTGKILEEAVPGEMLASLLYSDFPLGDQGISHLFSGKWTSKICAFAYFDLLFTEGALRSFAHKLEIDPAELLHPLATHRTRRALFTRQIRYETLRPLCDNDNCTASPSDSKLIMGDLAKDTTIRIKERFFDLHTLVGSQEKAKDFEGGTYGVFRLAPADYHYFHSPVTGKIIDCYELEGKYFSVNPIALTHVEQVLSSNKRVVMVIDTDVKGGTSVGKVGVIAVAAQVIGKITMGYSAREYDNPVELEVGMFIEKGRPIGVFEPGSSTVVVLFEPGKVEWCPDLPQLRDRPGVCTRYAENAFGKNLSEVRMLVRDTIAYKKDAMPKNDIPLGGGRHLVKQDADAGWRVQE